MSKKRTSAESSNDDTTSKGHGSQQDDNAKRAKRVSLSDTTLQDLPNELLEHILVKVVATEVISLKLVKSVWKEKSELVISRLSTVCSQWSNILSTTSFQVKLHRVLDGTAQPTYRLEILHQSAKERCTLKIAAMMDNVFFLWWVGVIDVYDRNDMTAVKDVIALGNVGAECIATCSASNNVYVLSRHRNHYINIMAIQRDEHNQFRVKTLISGMYMPNSKPSLEIASDGSLVLIQKDCSKPAVVFLLKLDGSVQSEIKVPFNIPKDSEIQVISKPTGNLVLIAYEEQAGVTMMEISVHGEVLQSCRCSANMRAKCGVGKGSPTGNLIISFDHLTEMELLDSDFNRLVVTIPDIYEIEGGRVVQMAFNSERNEILCLIANDYCRAGSLVIFRLAEE